MRTFGTWFVTQIVRVRFLLLALVVVMLGLEEVDRVAAQFPGVEGHTFSLSGMIGPLAVTRIGEWSGWADPSVTSPWLPLLLHILLDLAFIGIYLRLLLLAIDRWLPVPEEGAKDAVEQGRKRRFVRRAVVGLLILEALEMTGLIVGMVLFLTRSQIPEAFQVVFAVVATTKWVVVALVVSRIIVQPRFWPNVRAGLRELAFALHAQRLLVIVVVVLATLSLLPPWHELLEQLPDIERSWFDPGTEGRGLRHLVFAALLVIVLSTIAFALGRKRTQLYWLTHVDGKSGAGAGRLYKKAEIKLRPRRGWPGFVRYAIWSAPLLTVVALAAWFGFAPDRVDLTSFRAFVIVTGSVLVISLILEVVMAKTGWSNRRSDGTRVMTSAEADEARIRRVGVAGDLLSALVVVIGGLGLARSMGSLIIVDLTRATLPENPDRAFPLDITTLGNALAVVAGLVVAVAAILLATRLEVPTTDAAQDADPPETPPQGFRAQLRADLDPRVTRPDVTPWGLAFGLLFLALSVSFLVALGIAPIAVGEALGAVAVTVGLLGAMTTILGLLLLFLRRRRPLAIFAALGLRSDPVLALVVVIPSLIAVIAVSPVLHAVDRRETTIVASQRPDLQEAFNAWEEKTAACVAFVDVLQPDGSTVTQRIRPLVLVAAEGGGIRAATWTALTLAEFALDSECAASSVFLSSGVSGGSVGLAVTATIDGRDGSDQLTSNQLAGRIEERITDLGQSATLPAALTGLLAGDPFASTTGLLVPSLEWSTWRDRSALIEDSWRTVDDDLALPWDATATAPTGYVVFNSTDVLSGCRVVISQVDLGRSTDGSTTEAERDERPRCDQGGNEPPLTIDLIDAYPQGCTFNADWATAAMLSARFPVVTPGGIVDLGDACGRVDRRHGDDDRLQLVDGGYAENSGLGFLADVAPDLARIVTAYNAGSPADGAYVVPYVVYLENSSGAFLSARPEGSIAEATVPLAGIGSKATQVTPNSWIQRIMNALGPVCPPLDTTCDEFAPLVGVEGSTSQRVIIAAAGTEPSITVPLGWGLSNASFEQLRDSAQVQADPNCRVPAWVEYACVGSLLDAFPGESDQDTETD